MIIITKKLLKESKIKRKFNKLISHNDFEKKMEISKNKPKIKQNTSNSNKNLIMMIKIKKMKIQIKIIIPKVAVVKVVKIVIK